MVSSGMNSSLTSHTPQPCEVHDIQYVPHQRRSPQGYRQCDSTPLPLQDWIWNGTQETPSHYISSLNLQKEDCPVPLDHVPLDHCLCSSRPGHLKLSALSTYLVSTHTNSFRSSPSFASELNFLNVRRKDLM